jgi:hypothetical protein
MTEPSSDEESASSDSGDDKRVIATTTELQLFDPNFNVKRWKRMHRGKKKTVSAILQFKGWSKEEKKSNRSLSTDRGHFLNATRGLYSCHFSPRRTFESQDNALIAFLDGYKESQYYQYARVVPKVFSAAAVQKHTQRFHQVYICNI